MASIKPSLGLRTSQQLALTPQLQQSIRLLQMSTAELEQEVDRFLSENPLLEVSETASTAGESTPAESTTADSSTTQDDFAGEGLAGSAESWSAGGSRSGNDDDSDWWDNQQAEPTSLRAHLR